jgi:proteic killer suppression protein
MIESFKHTGLKLFYETGSTVGILRTHRHHLRTRLTALDTAICIEDLDLPEFQLYLLTRGKKMRWAVAVSDNWRITFAMENGNIYGIDYEEFH